MVSLDPNEMSQRDLYRLLIGAVVPRPIAFVSTCNQQGNTNVAPFSFFNGVSSRPPCLMIAIGPPPEGKEAKDTLKNIQEQKEFVVNTVHESFVDQVVQCAALYPYGESELDAAGLHTLPSDMVKAPRVKESPVHFECKLHKLVPVDESDPMSSTLVLGRIVKIHILDAAYKEKKVVFEELKPVARLGGISYGRVTEPYQRAVPKIGAN